MNFLSDSNSPFRQSLGRFRSDKLAVLGLAGILFIVLMALFAPLLANGRPFILISEGAWSFPALRYVFAPDTSEILVEKLFNFCMIWLPFILLTSLLPFMGRWRKTIFILSGLLLLIPFFAVSPRMDKTDWRMATRAVQAKPFVVFAPVPYGPYEIVGTPYEKPSGRHLFGTDQIGRDVLSRMLYGARISLAVGLLATGISMLIGILTGMAAGYYGGRIDMILMRIVEIQICFPTFLLLLILMSILLEYKFKQSILLVIAVLGFTGWTGLCRLVRGEVLKQRSMAYIQSCESLGVPVWRTMFFHLLPNVTAPIIVSFTFDVAGAVMAESGLSFLGFGVKAPTASWGELLRQAFPDPFTYWHLTLWPGIALFITVLAFNFAGEGVRRVLDPKSANE